MVHGYILITGGAGFVGSNLANRLLDLGRPVVLFDDLSRGHVHRNVQWLKRRHGDDAMLRIGALTDAEAVDEVVAGADAVVHLGARTSVAASIDAPALDFAVNATGTLHVLEAARRCANPPLVVHASTHEVYGRLEDVPLEASVDRWEPADPTLRAHGIGEDRPLRFATPHGCSKGAAEQYVLDWAHTYHLPATVLRLGRVYGPRQFGDEDEAYVAQMIVRSRRGAPLHIPGDGRAVRDLLYVDDLVDALLAVLDAPEAVVGRAFNVGGGAGLTASRVELVRQVEALHGQAPEVLVGAAPHPEPRWFVSDTRRFEAATGWAPRTPLVEGLRRLDQWLSQLDRNAPPTMVLRRRRVAPVAMERT